MPFQLPPIAKLAERLMLDIEQAVRRFPRYHRYAVGAKLREQAFEVTTLTHRAWKEQARKHQWAQQLVWAIDALKISLQLCSQLKAFTSFRQFEALAKLAHDLGKQAGGWKKQLDRHRSGQNAQAESAFAQRAQLDTVDFASQAFRAAANSAAGFSSSNHTARKRPSVDAGAFFSPARWWALRDALSCLWRAARGSRKARRPVCRSANPASSATSGSSAMADSSAHTEIAIMLEHQHSPAAEPLLAPVNPEVAAWLRTYSGVRHQLLAALEDHVRVLNHLDILLQSISQAAMQDGEAAQALCAVGSGYIALSSANEQRDLNLIRQVCVQPEEASS